MNKILMTLLLFVISKTVLADHEVYELETAIGLVKGNDTTVVYTAIPLYSQLGYPNRDTSEYQFNSKQTYYGTTDFRRLKVDEYEYLYFGKEIQFKTSDYDTIVYMAEMNAVEPWGCPFDSCSIPILTPDQDDYEFLSSNTPNFATRVCGQFCERDFLVIGFGITMSTEEFDKEFIKKHPYHNELIREADSDWNVETVVGEIITSGKWYLFEYPFLN